MTPLDLPDMRMRDSDPLFTSGAVCYQICLKYYRLPLQPIAASPIDGTDPRTLEAALWIAGLSCQSGGMDIKDLAYHTRRGRPVVCLTTDEEQPHWIVCGGVKRGKVFFQDPMPECGWMQESIEAFEQRWIDRNRQGIVFSRWAVSVG